jgi:general secretion pathway protein M
MPALPTLPAERDRWLALGLLLSVLVLAYFVLLHPWWTVPMRETGERIAALQERELRIRTQLQQAPEISRRLAQAVATQRTRPGFLPEATPELASAGLVQRLELVVGQASPGNRSCAITNRSPQTDPHPGERFPRVVVQVQLRCGAAETAAVLHALESGSPRVFVDNLNILAQRYFYLPGQNRSSSGGLNVSFDMIGYIAPVRTAPTTTSGRTRRAVR